MKIINHNQHSIRSFSQDRKTYYVGSDVCKALGIKNTSQALSKYTTTIFNTLDSNLAIPGKALLIRPSVVKALASGTKSLLEALGLVESESGVSNTSIQTFKYSRNISVDFTSEAWFNATSVALLFEKRPTDWLKLKSTKEYMKALQGIFNCEESSLLKTRSGKYGGGTWFHPKLAVAFSRWLDVSFSVWCDAQVDRIIREGLKEIPKQEQPTIQDPMIAAIVVAMQQLDLVKQAQVGLEKRQELIQEEQARQEARLYKVECRIETSSEDYYSVAGYASLKGYQVTASMAATLGRKATKLALELDYVSGRVHSDIFGQVNTYHKDILKKVVTKTSVYNLTPEGKKAKDQQLNPTKH